MKKLFLFVIALMLSIQGKAQVWFGGSVGLNYDNYTTSVSIFSTTFAPEMGFYLSERTAFAINANYAYSKTGIYEGSTFMIHSVSTEPYIRLVVAKSNLATFFFDGGLTVGYNWTITKRQASMMGYTYPHTDVDGSFHCGFGIRPGITIEVSPKVILVAKLGFIGYKYERMATEPIYHQYTEKGHHKFGLGIDNNTISIGVNYIF